MELKFTVNHQIIKHSDNQQIVARSQNYIKLNFVFTDDWKKVYKKIFFKALGEDSIYEDILDSNNSCVLPYMPNSNMKLELWLLGLNQEEKIVITTAPIKLDLLKAGEVQNTIFPEIVDVRELVPDFTEVI